MGTWAWINEGQPARWDENKARIVGAEAPGVFDSRYAERRVGELLSGLWWRVEAEGHVVAYGWMDVVWGDAEVLLAVARDQRGRGVGSFVMEQLEREARTRGLRYVTNVVRPTHPEKDRIVGWLEKRGFKSGEDGRHFRSPASV
ncbi:MAG: GNAT family N-acetyltransferase [Sandaracinus sp.]|nr:GNAT family N-acetyltransferase [Sandaracinus sp.]MCB9631556.1 GNAT family N-acetyltransferase [Sandaracinus sp.]